FEVRTFNGSLPIKIKNDNDVKFFIIEIENPEYRSPLYVETKQNVSSFKASNENPIHQSQIFEDTNCAFIVDEVDGHEEPLSSPVLSHNRASSCEPIEHLENTIDNATLAMVHTTNSNNVGGDLPNSISSESSAIELANCSVPRMNCKQN